jgi:peptidoglycan/xylan/chitin deacetylase (PgdA/CDA1 family)
MTLISAGKPGRWRIVAVLSLSVLVLLAAPHLLVPTPIRAGLNDLTNSAGPPAAAHFDSCLHYAALTFDDGPNEGTAPALEVLRRKRVRATFMLRGDSVRAYASVVKRMMADGHDIGNHAYSHPDLTTLSSHEISAEIARTQAEISALTGRAPTLARPPYGLFDESVLRVYRDFGLTNVLWTVHSEDWTSANVDTIVSRTVDGSVPGAVILLHEQHAGTRAALPRIIDGLRARGYCFGRIVPSHRPVVAWEDRLYYAAVAPW